MLEFAGVKPGQTVADFLPGGGYFTRIFAKAVGEKGVVYAVIDAAAEPRAGRQAEPDRGGGRRLPQHQRGAGELPDPGPAET